MTCFQHFGTMIDCSRNAVMNVDAVKRWIDLTADLGYNALHLYMEDTYEIDHNPYFGHLRGRYSKAELREIDRYAAEKNMEVIPCIQTLAHVNALFHWQVYREIQDVDDILLAGDERTYALVEDMFSTLRQTLRTHTINVGMDEAGLLGLGKYLNEHGYQNRYSILMTHLNKISEIAKKYDFELLMWGDMFFRLASGGEYYSDNGEIPEEVRQMVPENVHLIYWDYYSYDMERYERKIDQHNAIKPGAWFAGGLWCWSGFAPHNTFSLRSMRCALEACQKKGVQNVLLTMWGDNGAECSKFSMLPSLFYMAQIANGISDDAQIRANFEKKFGIPFDAFLLLDLPGTPNESDERIFNPDKYMLYCDPFMGQFDSRVRPTDAACYPVCAEKLAKWTDFAEYGYLFRTQKALCDLLAVKFDLGVRTRNTYLSGDRAALRAMAPDYDQLLERLDAFYDAYEAQWMHENKPHGFDVIDLRLGGLRQRIVHCRRRLLQYCDGSLPRIEELDEPVLDCYCENNAEAAPTTRARCWNEIATANVV